MLTFAISIVVILPQVVAIASTEKLVVVLIAHPVCLMLFTLGDRWLILDAQASLAPLVKDSAYGHGNNYDKEDFECFHTTIASMHLHSKCHTIMILATKGI